MNAVAPMRIGTVAVFPASNEIDDGAGRQRVPPRLMALLLRLARDAGTPVDRTTLLDEVWSRRGVTDEVLSRAVADLRTALGDDAREPRYIETLPKIGYRLVAAVVPLDADASADATSATRSVTAVGPERRHPARTATLAAAVVAALALAAVMAGWRAGEDPSAALQRRIAGATVLSAGDEFEVAPRFSPDASSIAYAVGERTSRIVVEDLATRTRRTIGPDGGLATSPAFFPDGRRIAYLRVVDTACSLVEVALDGDAMRTIAPCPTGMRARFDLSPDGRTIVAAATRQRDVPAGLIAIDVATAETRWLTAPEPGRGDDVQPRYAADGRRIAFFRGSESQRELWLLDVASPRDARRVGKQAGLTYGAAFLPDGASLLVAADWPGFRALVRVDLATGADTLVGGRGARFPDVARDGSVAFELASYRANLWRVDVAGGRAPSIAWPATRYTSQPEISPDGQRLVFVSNRDGGEALYVAPVDGDAKRVPASDEFRTTRPRWSHDGRWLYAVRTRRGDPASVSVAVRIDPDSGAAQALDRLGERVHDVTPAADGRTLYVGERADHAVRLLRASVDGGTPERLPLPLVSEFRVAGDRLAYAQPQLTGLTVCTLPALACRPIDVPIDDLSRFDWTLAPDAVWRQVPTDGGAKLARIDLTSGRETLRLDFGPTANGVAIAAGPRGVPLYVAREERTQVDLMIARIGDRP